jgi:hypothetical protein
LRSPGAAHSPLLRPVDRSDVRAGHLLLTVLLLIGPLLTGWVCSAVWDAARASQQAERAAVFQVDATVRELTPSTSPYVTLTWAGATWRAPDGGPRSGLITSSAATRVGAVVRIWTNSKGEQVPEPTGLDEVVAATVAAGIGSGLVLGTAAAVLYGQLGSRFDQRRYRLWDEEWAAVEPQWTRSP